MKTVGTLFSGCGGKTMAAAKLGYLPIWAVDNWMAACEFYYRNVSQNVYCVDVLTANPEHLPAPDLLLASPPCTSFSYANRNGIELPIDIEMARKVAQFIRVHQPSEVLVENVTNYLSSDAVEEIIDALIEGQYYYDIDIYNTADFGLPQKRRRMILRGSRTIKIPPPIFTHCQKGGHLPKWQGWYQAIEDLIPTMSPSKLTQAQKFSVRNKRGKPEMPVIIQRIGYGKAGPVFWHHDKPVGSLRAHLANDGKGGGRGHVRYKYMDYYDPRTKEALSINVPVLSRLMGFPPEIQWPEDIRDAVRMIGNAAPIPLIEPMLRSFQ